MSTLVHSIQRNETLFFRQLHTMFSSGVGLLDSIEYIERGVSDPDFSLVLKECYKEIANGSSFSRALARHKGTFDSLYIQLIVVGESTGALVQALEQIATLGESRLRRQQHLGSAMAYPICLLTVMFLVCAIFVLFVAPGDSEFMKLLGDDVPWPSQVLITVSSFLQNPLFLSASLLSILSLVLIFRRFYSTSTGFRWQFDALIRRVPVIGELDNNLDTARLLDVVSTCLQVGLDVISSLKYGAAMCRNECNRRDLKEAIQGVTRGEMVAEALGSYTSLPPLAICLIDVGEVSGKLQEMTAHTAQMISEDVNYQIDVALELVEPILLCVGGTVAGFVAIAAFLPIMRLVANFS
jgi:type II secretory pathway component PulF